MINWFSVISVIHDPDVTKTKMCKNIKNLHYINSFFI